MNKLSQECIKVIEQEIDKDFNSHLPIAKAAYKGLMTIALTNPTIYQSAWLMSVEEALRFAEWLPKQKGLGYSIEDKAWFSNSGTSRHTIAELLTIFRNQNKG